MKKIILVCLTALVIAGTAQLTMGSDSLNRIARADIEKALRRELSPLPGVFDHVAFKLDNDGTVTLLGQVREPTLKAQLEEDTMKVAGIKRVRNQIEVLPPLASDDEIRTAVYNAIYSQSGLARYQLRAVPPIYIIVKNGFVTLEGVAANRLERAKVNATANDVPGVFSVKTISIQTRENRRASEGKYETRQIAIGCHGCTLQRTSVRAAGRCFQTGPNKAICRPVFGISYGPVQDCAKSRRRFLNASKNFSAHSSRTFRRDRESNRRNFSGSSRCFTSHTSCLGSVYEVGRNQRIFRRRPTQGVDRDPVVFVGSIEFRACRRNCCGREPHKSRHPDDHEDPGQIPLPCWPSGARATKVCPKLRSTCHRLKRVKR